MDGTLEGRTAQLMKDRMKDAENAPVTRLGRGVHSETIEDRAILRVMQTPEQAEALRQAKAPQAEAERAEPAERIKAPEQHVFRPPGFSMGFGPNVKADLAGTITPEQGRLNQFHMLNHGIAEKAHETQAQQLPEPPREPAIDKIRAMIGDENRPTIRMLPARMQRQDHERD